MMRIKDTGLAVVGALAAAAAAAAVVEAAPVVHIEAVEDASVNDSTPSKAAKVACPPGQVALGAWAMIEGADTEVALKGVFPQPMYVGGGPNMVTAVAVEVPPGTDDPWRVRVFATCADVLLGSIEWVKSTGAANSESHKSATATCPNGRVVVGTGGAVFSGGGAVILTAFYPSPSLSSVTAQASEIVSFGGLWDVTAYAVCANHDVFDDLTVASRTFLKTDFVWAECPARSFVISGGAKVDTGSGKILLRSVNSYTAMQPLEVGAGVQTMPGLPPQWHLQSLAICASNVQT
jgi:hypothetical protein